MAYPDAPNAHMHEAWKRFKADASRWVIPEHFSNPDEITLPKALSLLRRHRQLRAVAWFRLGSWGQAAGVRGAGWFADQRMQGGYGLDLPVSTDIAGGFYLAHPNGVAITANRIGANATLVGAITIGIKGPGNAPTIGDNVYVGAGARVIGSIELGDGVTVGANSVVNRDVADNLTVVGAPAKPIVKSQRSLDGTETPSAHPNASREGLFSASRNGFL